ncbi:hypothetical protein [Microbacterium terricola]|uniref:Bacterial Ig-like domain-containing protein n=1 Tax=Microbacterium terricola TaxID=344163 RepID=A0ABM8DXT7_9MICO|nr:hypothetical protein [Microbacterium terricola]UYK38889.1 hypothetical protein OAU46_09220 [Microbacterium terricola]BDV30415.1 hypothetical protein Microterr_10750 [Microbacterium terricola]
MNRTLLLRAAAVTVTAALMVGAAPAAYADDEVVADPASVQITEPGVLTLPDGDGVRDSAAVTVSSDVPTTASLSIVSGDGLSTLATLAPVELTAENLAETVYVPVTGLVAGTLSLVATPSVGEPVIVPLTVGSGQPESVTLTLSRTVLYSWSKSTGNTATASVSAVDETELAIPFAGSVVTTAGAVTKSAPVASTAGATAKTTISATGLPAGTASVVAKIGAASSSATTITVRQVAITGTKLATSTTTIYPVRDGYRDSVKIAVSSTATNGSTIPATGTVKVTRSGKTVKTYKLTSSKRWTATWDGKVSGKVVPGTYKVSVSIKGPEGATKTASKTVTVKKGNLVTKTTSKWVKAGSLMQEYLPLDRYERGYCEAHPTSGAIACVGYDAYNGGDVISLIAVGGTTVPATVRAGAKFGGAKVRLTMNATSVKGMVAWAYGASTSDTPVSGELTKGAKTLGWTSVPSGEKTIGISIALGKKSSLGADKIKIEYSYKVLVNT